MHKEYRIQDVMLIATVFIVNFCTKGVEFHVIRFISLQNAAATMLAAVSMFDYHTFEPMHNNL